MNLFKSTLAAALLLSTTYASAISFYSDITDPSNSSSATSTNTDAHWIDPTNTVLAGATWIQPSSTWKVDASDFSFYELDLSGSIDYNLTSLFLSFDDDVKIYNGTALIFDSLALGITDAWTNIYDVFAYTSFNTLISSPDYLTFAVKNSENGATGIIWSGTADAVVDVPEPSMLFVLGLGLIAFAYKRNKNSKA